MNVHHLELFYYVARHGGITEAVRNIPYGIQQPAVSGQVAQLEEYLGVQLFRRRPFALTPQGERLFKFIQPFFGNLDTIAAELQGGTVRHLRIGASTIVLRDHLPAFFRSICQKYPNLKISLREGRQAELEACLEEESIDLAITILEKKLAPGVHGLPLIDLPLVLLVEKNSPISSPAQLWASDRIEDSLICLPETEAVCRHFRRGLDQLKVDWFPTIEVSSLDLIQTYVANGFGIGVAVKLPQTPVPPGLRVLPLPATPFAPVTVGALWRGRTSALLQAFTDELQLAAKRIAAQGKI